MVITPCRFKDVAGGCGFSASTVARPCFLIVMAPGIAVCRTASLPLAYVPAIHDLPRGTKNVDARA